MAIFFIGKQGAGKSTLRNLVGGHGLAIHTAIEQPVPDEPLITGEEREVMPKPGDWVVEIASVRRLK